MINKNEVENTKERQVNMNKMNLLKNQKGFTLAETLITLTILGVIAAITVPSLINKQIESANRTKLKKAMAVYEKALNQMIIDNGVKGSLNTVEGFRTTDTCSESTKYFKKVEQKSDCVFKTADRVWWDITDIENPIIMLKDKYIGTPYDHDASVTEAQTENNKEVFAMLGHRDTSGVLRINDKGYEDSITSGNDTRKAEMAKLYNFINNTEGTSGSGTDGGTTEKCTLKTGSTKDYECEGSELTWKKESIDAAEFRSGYFCIWDGTTCTKYEDNTSKVSAGDLFVSEPITLTQDDIDKSCEGSKLSNACKKNDYWNAYIKKCEQNGSHLATTAELRALNSAGKLDSGSRYWAAETHSNSYNQSYYFDPIGGPNHNGYAYSDIITRNIYVAVCVGN